MEKNTQKKKYTKPLVKKIGSITKFTLKKGSITDFGAGLYAP